MKFQAQTSVGGLDHLPLPKRCQWIYLFHSDYPWPESIHFPWKHSLQDQCGMKLKPARPPRGHRHPKPRASKKRGDSYHSSIPLRSILPTALVRSVLFIYDHWGASALAIGHWHWENVVETQRAIKSFKWFPWHFIICRSERPKPQIAPSRHLCVWALPIAPLGSFEICHRKTAGSGKRCPIFGICRKGLEWIRSNVSEHLPAIASDRQLELQVCTGITINCILFSRRLFTAN